jgi:DNA-binding transcriptional LysR family regulator
LVLNLEDLRAFTRIADLGSLSGAARALQMPKSSVSRSLVRLEQTVGAALVERSTRHVRLTDAGLLLQRHARRILDDVVEAENAIGGLIGRPRGDLRVSAPFTFAVGPLAQMLPGFLEQYPDVRVVLTVDNQLVDLLTAELDIAIRIGAVRPDWISRRLAKFALWPCAGREYLAGHADIVTPDHLAAHALIAHADRRETWVFRSADGAVCDFSFAPGVVVPEPDVLRTMLIGGAGIGLLPDFHATQAIKEGTLVRVLSNYDVGTVDAYALYPSHRSLSAKVRVFIDSLAKQCALMATSAHTIVATTITGTSQPIKATTARPSPRRRSGTPSR